MIFETTRRVFVIPLVSVIVSGTVCAARADDAAGRTFAFCDKNQDGKLDAAELDAIPASMRDWLAQHGPKSKAGVSQSDFLRLYPKMMADLRKQTPVASASGGSPRAAAPKADPPPKTSAPTAAAKPPLYASTPPSDDVEESPRPTNLPASYQDADLDKDGQIDYFEWRKAKLGNFVKFQEFDLNNDSVLSAQELAAGGGTPGSSTASSSAATSPGAGSSGDSKTGPTKAVSAPSTPGGPSEEYLTQVKYYFEIMDKQKGNGNGMLDPLEWNASARIKPAFEQAKIDITKPMDEKTFIAHYLKVFPEPPPAKKSGPVSGAKGPVRFSGKTGRRTGRKR